MGEASISLLSDCLQSWSWWDLNRILTGAGNDWSTSPPSTRKLNGRRGDLFSNFQEKNQFKGRRKLCHRKQNPSQPYIKFKLWHQQAQNGEKHIQQLIAAYLWGVRSWCWASFYFSIFPSSHMCTNRKMSDWLNLFLCRKNVGRLCQILAQLHRRYLHCKLCQENVYNKFVMDRSGFFRQ